MTHAMRLLIAGSAVLLSVLTGSAEAQIDTGDNLPVHEVALSNGMRLLVLPREGAPTVSFVVSYDVGSIQEQPGKTGIAHLLEHLLFKGTTTIGTRDVSAERVLFAEMDQVFDTVLTLRSSQPGSPRIPHLEGRIEELEDSARTFLVPNEFDGILSRNGARGLNATTTAEITHYFVELPANRTELWFVLEADRMRKPRVPGVLRRARRGHGGAPHAGGDEPGWPPLRIPLGDRVPGPSVRRSGRGMDVRSGEPHPS